MTSEKTIKLQRLKALIEHAILNPDSQFIQVSSNATTIGSIDEVLDQRELD